MEKHIPSFSITSIVRTSIFFISLDIFKKMIILEAKHVIPLTECHILKVFICVTVYFNTEIISTSTSRGEAESGQYTHIIRFA